LGQGKNGKSTLFNAWAHVIGDYGRSVAIETFLSANAAARRPSPDLARLEGVRFVRTSEPERGAKLAEALIKLATGGEPMTVRHLSTRTIFELLPSFKLVMSGNYRPEIAGPTRVSGGALSSCPGPFPFRRKNAIAISATSSRPRRAAF
jgi:putative DNA primase/helicase